MTALVGRGHLRRDPNQPRSLEGVHPAGEVRELPLLGSAAATTSWYVAASQETARNGQVVVAPTGGSAATMKRFCGEHRDQVRPQLANPAVESPFSGWMRW